MIYLVTKQDTLFKSDLYTKISVEESLEQLKSWDIIQFDTETSGRNPHICQLLCCQFGNDAHDSQIVVDCQSISILVYKEILETKELIIQNGKFDLQFLYNYKIIPTKVWDTMIVEQALYLGYDRKFFHFSLAAIAERRLHQFVDKTVRGEIIWRGLDDRVIQYAADDVTLLEKIRDLQIKDIQDKHCKIAIQIENGFVPVIAYLEWCGICLDTYKWKKKMLDNEEKKDQALHKLNNWLIELSKENWLFKKYTDYAPDDLFKGFFDTQVTLNWNSPTQVIGLAKELGFNTSSRDKKTNETIDSVTEKVLKKQKAINPDFINYYFAYKDKQKDCSTYGETYIDAINPKTGRIHTKFQQLGADSGRMSCGGGNRDFDTDLANFKHITSKKCKFVQIQNLPADEITRSAFVSQPGNLLCSCDFSALESRLGADIYQEKEMLDEFLYRSGDIHSLCAKLVFKEELKDVEIKDIESVRPDLRKKVKPIEFSQQFK